MTLRWRLTLIYTTLLFLVLGLVMVLLYGNLRNTLYNNALNDLNDSFRQIIKGNQRSNSGNCDIVYPNIFYQIDIYVNTRSSKDFATLPYKEGIDGILPACQSSAFYLNFAEENKENYRFSINLSEYQRLVKQVNANQDTLPQITIEKFTSKNNKDHHFIVRAILVDQTISPESEKTGAIIYLGRDLVREDQTLLAIRNIMLLIGLFSLLGLGGAAYYLAGRALMPLRQVRKAAAGITGKTLGQRVPLPDTRDEVAALALTLNKMLDRLEGSFETQRRFTSDASHELRTPITAIGGHAGYLLRRTNPTEQQSESLNIIKNESLRLGNLVASLLELARADGGAVPLELQTMQAQAFLGDVAKEMRPIAQNATLEVTGEEISLLADPNRLRQVFINLIANALKAGSSRVVLQVDHAQEGAHFMIADNGPGIAPEHLSKLFDRFYRVEESRSRDAGGSGLGLAIVKTIVDAHGGMIWVESEVGVGTQVHLVLPLEEEASPAPSKPRLALRLPPLVRRPREARDPKDPKITGETSDTLGDS